MNVGLVTTWFARGAAYHARQHRDALSPEHRVFIYARGGEALAVGDPAWDDGSVHWARPGLVPLRSTLDLDDFRAWIRARHLDAVIFLEQWWWEPVVVAAELGLLTGVIVNEYTEPDIPFYACFDFLIVNTRQHAGIFDWHPQVFFVPWGVDLDAFRPRAVAPLAPGLVTFVHLAGMNPHRKGTDLAVRAFARLRDPARLVVHTQIPLEQSVPEVVPLVRELAAAGLLSLHTGTTAHPSSLYALGDVCVYPSRFDGLGLTVAEALACALPVIVSDNPPLSEWMDETTGRLVRIRRRYARSDGVYWPQFLCDEEHLAEQLAWYPARLDRLDQFRRQARAYAERHLNWCENARRLPALLAAARRLPGKTSTLTAARAFERERARQSPRFWLSYHHPRWVRAVRSLWRFASGRRPSRWRTL